MVNILMNGTGQIPLRLVGGTMLLPNTSLFCRLPSDGKIMSLCLYKNKILAVYDGDSYLIDKNGIWEKIEPSTFVKEYKVRP